jgi:hypothetical protein
MKKGIFFTALIDHSNAVTCTCKARTIKLFRPLQVTFCPFSSPFPHYFFILLPRLAQPRSLVLPCLFHQSFFSVTRAQFWPEEALIVDLKDKNFS